MVRNEKIETEKQTWMEKASQRQRGRKRKKILACVCLLTCIGNGKAVGSLYVVDMRDQVKGSFRSIRAGVVKEDS